MPFWRKLEALWFAHGYQVAVTILNCTCRKNVETKITDKKKDKVFPFYNRWSSFVMVQKKGFNNPPFFISPRLELLIRETSTTSVCRCDAKKYNAIKNQKWDSKEQQTWIRGLTVYAKWWTISNSVGRVFNIQLSQNFDLEWQKLQ